MNTAKIRFEHSGAEIYLVITCAECGEETAWPAREATAPDGLHCPECGWVSSLTGEAASALEEFLGALLPELEVPDSVTH